MKPIKHLTRLGLIVCLAGLFLSAHATNIIENGGFDGGFFPWEPPGWWDGVSSGSYEVDAEGRFCVTVTSEGAEWAAQLRQLNRSFYQGATYNVSLKAWSTTPISSLEMSAADESGGGFVWIFGTDLAFSAPLDDAPDELSFMFTAAADTETGNFRFLFGGGNVPAGETVCFDDIVVDGPINVLTNTTFADNTLQLPGEVNFWEGAGSFAVSDERLCLDINDSGDNEWGINFRERGLSFTSGVTYQFSADFWTSQDINIQISAADESSGFVWIFGSDFAIPTTPLDGAATPVSASFTAGADSDGNGDFRFLLGSDARVPDGTTVCFDNLRLLDPQGAAGEEVPPPSPVHVNQLGYLPFASKRATYALPEDATDIETPRAWALMQGEAVIAMGATTLHSAEIDAASGDLVHTIDFSPVATEGVDYTLAVTEGDEVFISEPFAIGSNLFTNLKYEALAYFYHNRSGTPILAEVVGEELARPAGHESDVAVDTLACLDGNEGCLTLDVSGGWYDAGDHGKYVVNGGISVWTLLNLYERSKHQGDNLDDFADGSMQLPPEETANGVSDLLDEARWEIEWFFKMQVPYDQALSGMVYHKMHDQNWTGLPLAPHEDTQVRYVHPPSTAATLNFAAVGAQCYRVYKRIDRQFAFECLFRAMHAYYAAKTNPVIFAATAGNGGGTYSDFNVEDEFYWAATELYLATGHPFYAKDMLESPLHLTVPEDQISLMTWQQTNALGVLSLATVGDRYFVNKHWVKQAQQAVIAAADQYLASITTEGYAVPISAESYPWGSNSFIVNNLIVLGLANDFSCGDDKYANAMLEGVDYLFGRNPMGHSYVTGYGTRSEQNPHHRFWANSLNSAYPAPPPGVMSGGPNSSIEDPIAQGVLQGCLPQRCFIDHIDAWSVNEITINWNAPFAWTVAYLDELATSDPVNGRDRKACHFGKHKHVPHKWGWDFFNPHNGKKH
jgi:endoglucanase